MKEFAYQRLPTRLVARLLDLSNRGRIISGPSPQALADMLGTYGETVGTRLRGFRDVRLLKSGYRRTELRDATGLRAAAGEPVRISDLPIEK